MASVNSKTLIGQGFIQKILTKDSLQRRDKEAYIGVRKEFDHYFFDRDNFFIIININFYFPWFIFNKSLYLYQKKIGINTQQYRLL